MNTAREHDLMPTRRQLFGRAAVGIGTAALGSLLTPDASASPGLSGFPNFPPRAKRVIYLHQSGAPSQMDIFDPKPDLAKRYGEDLPDSIRNGQRLTGMTSNQKKFPVAPSIYKFAQYGKSGTWFSERVLVLSNCDVGVPLLVTVRPEIEVPVVPVAALAKVVCGFSTEMAAQTCLSMKSAVRRTCG